MAFVKVRLYFGGVDIGGFFVYDVIEKGEGFLTVHEAFSLAYPFVIA
jgi:hypothetical protein